MNVRVSRCASSIAMSGSLACTDRAAASASRCPAGVADPLHGRFRVAGFSVSAASPSSARRRSAPATARVQVAGRMAGREVADDHVDGLPTGGSGRPTARLVHPRRRSIMPSSIVSAPAPVRIERAVFRRLTTPNLPAGLRPLERAAELLRAPHDLADVDRAVRGPRSAAGLHRACPIVRRHRLPLRSTRAIVASGTPRAGSLPSWRESAAMSESPRHPRRRLRPGRRGFRAASPSATPSPPFLRGAAPDEVGPWRSPGSRARSRQGRIGVGCGRPCRRCAARRRPSPRL